MNTAATPNPEPSPDDIAQGLAALELVANTEPGTETDVAVAEVVPEGELVDGETKRVARLEAEVAEAHRLYVLQSDDTPLMVDTPKVRKMRMRAAEASRLHELAQDPMVRAYKAAKMRRLFTTVLVVALTLALAWSTAGVQAFAADGAKPWSAAWLLAWLVEPFISLALLGVVGSRAYLAVQGSPLSGEAESTTKKIEYLFLGLSLGMNAYPYLPGIAAPFELHRLVLHVLGPVIAVAVVLYLPVLLRGFTDLNFDTGEASAEASHKGGTPGAYRENARTPYPRTPSVRTPDIEALAARVRALIAAEKLPPNPGIHKIREALKPMPCSTDTARAIKHAL